MDGDINIDQLAFTKFAVGQPVPRNEDPILLRGQGRYTDDLNLPGQAYAVIVRSRYAHGVINAHRHRRSAGDAGRARRLYRAGHDRRRDQADAARAAIPTRDGTPMRRPAWPVLTSDKVRYVGDPVAIVVAETAVEAKDAAEAVLLDIEPLPAVTRAERCRQPRRAAIA